ncbi:MAG TPA: tetratricopeptide repeat protein, partial [Dehalococcoidia bacterium]|nr:tetratricopeptide repeat protein [Dehalococcoidia bacterium]
MDETGDMQEDLDAGYQEMARDEVREPEALEWDEATVSNAWSAVTLPREESLRRLKKTLAALEQSLGADHLDTLHARRRLAHRHRADGDFSEALHLFQAN